MKLAHGFSNGLLWALKWAHPKLLALELTKNYAKVPLILHDRMNNIKIMSFQLLFWGFLCV